VIIDVRENGGGNDALGYAVLDALGFGYSGMGMVSRYSQYSRLTAIHKNTWRRRGHKIVPFKYGSANKNNVELKVFVNEFTGSAAISGLAAQVRYSDLGQIIGRMPGQNVNFCGNILMLQLKNSKVVFVLPTTYSFFERNEQRASGELRPDIEVSGMPSTANYMKYVVWN
jgi:C-terminal processing protease CtpA/Prc